MLFVGGASEPTALVVKQARELGFKGGFLVMDQAKLDEMARVVGGMETLEGAIGVLPVSADPSPVNKAFIDRFGKKFDSRVPGSEALWNYTAVHATAKAMQLAGTATDAKAIHAKLDEAYKSLSPEVNPGSVLGVDANGGTLTKERGGAVKDGKIEVISTEKK